MKPKMSVRRLLEKVGIVMFFAAWPAFRFYLRASERTRIIVVHNGKVLATKNWVSDNLWSLPGGGLHKNEPVVQGALRELQEETGLTTTSQQLRFIGKRQYRQYGLSYDFHIFVLQIENVGALKLQRHEISRAQWFTPTTLLAERISDDTRQALNAWLKP